VKAGTEVLVSVRNAIVGTDLGQLREAVRGSFWSWTSRNKVCARCWQNGKRPDAPAGDVSQWLTSLEPNPEAKAVAQRGGRREGGTQLKARRYSERGVWFGLGMMD